MKVHKLLRIYLTIPVITSTAERKFSALRFTKDQDLLDEFNELSSTKSQHCLHVLRDRTDLLDSAKEFNERNE